MRRGGTVRRLWLAAALTIVLSLVFGHSLVLAESPAPAVLIIDSSGSMTARLPDGRIKLDAARQVIDTTLKSWPPGGEVAVIAYGHRRKSDCSDIETLVPLGPPAPEMVEKALLRLKARGKTPLSQSLIQAAAQLPAGGTIILVSDGIETCDRDPCEVARTLKAAQAALFIHVVGFGLQREEVDQLKCIAENAGGRFYDAQDFKGLTTALDTVSHDVAEPQPPTPKPAPSPPQVAESSPPPPPAPKAEPPRVVRTELDAVAGALGEIIDTPVHWLVRDGKGDDVYDGESRALVLDLLPGAYEVTTLAANARNETRIDVKEGQGQTFKVDLRAGRLDLSLSSHKGAAPYTDQETSGLIWHLEPKEGQAAATVPAIARPALLLAPGAYRVAAELKGLTAEADANINAGVASHVALDFRLGSVVLEAMLEGAEQPFSDAGALHWRIGTGTSANTVEGEARPRLTLPEGTYPVDLSIAGFTITSNADVHSGDEKLVRILVKGGTLVLSAHLGPQSPALEDWRDASWTVTPVETPGPGEPLDFQTAAPSVTLPIGRWHVAVKSGAAAAEEDVSVAPGSSVALPLNLNAGRLGMRARPETGAQPANIVFAVAAVDQNGNPSPDPIFEAGSSEELSTILPGGRWRITADDSDGRHGEATVDLAIGEEKNVELVLK